MQGHNRSPLIFVVDDDASTVCTICGLLKRAGFGASSAGAMAEAMCEIRNQRPDLILLDVNLEDGSGFDLCRSLRADADSSETPILFISANEDTSAKVQGFESGGVDYITKPIAGSELLARVRTHLRLKQAYDRLAQVHAERIQSLASTQQDLMARAEELPAARFQVCIRQMLTAGGDFYDVIPAGGDLVDYMVADISGHDLAASLWTASLKTLASEYAGPLHDPLDVVHTINNSLRRFLPPGAFLTLVYARLNRHTGSLSLVSAGHPPAIVVRAEGEASHIVRQQGDVVGVFADAVYGTAELNLNPGDRVFLYTDGLIETDVTHEQGIQRLANACFSRRTLPLEQIVPTIVDEVLTGLTPADDTLLMGVER